MPKLNAETFTGPLFLLGASLVAMASMVAVVVSSPSAAQERTAITLPQPQYTTTSTVPTTTPTTVAAVTTPPPIFVNAGIDGATVNNPALTVAGTTAPGTQLMVNGAAIVADASGNWSLPVTLSLGPNAIPVKATDPAGNVSTRTITVTYTPAAATTTTAPPATAPPATAPAPTTTAKPRPRPTTPPTNPPPPTTPPPPVDTGP